MFLVALLLAGSIEAKKPAIEVLTPENDFVIDTLTVTEYVVYDEYRPGEMGIYGLCCADTLKRYIVTPENILGFCDKTDMLLFTTDNGYFKVRCGKELKKKLKKDNRVEKCDNWRMYNDLNSENRRYKERYEKKNVTRRREISDSIKEAKAREVALEKQRKERARIEELMQYSETHKNDWRDIEDTKIRCVSCNERHKVDYARIVGAIAEGIVLQDVDSLASPLLHVMSVKPSDLSDKLKYHFEAMADSISALNTESTVLSMEYVTEVNDRRAAEEEKIRRILIREAFPNGVISEWNWNDEYGMVTFGATYFNSSSQTIKYIEFHFVIYNDVKDRRGAGSFKGTGPVEPWDAGSWEWDRSHYFVSGDATKMKIVKVIITYMNGTKKVLTGDSIKYLND